MHTMQMSTNFSCADFVLPTFWGKTFDCLDYVYAASNNRQAGIADKDKANAWAKLRFAWQFDAKGAFVCVCVCVFVVFLLTPQCVCVCVAGFCVYVFDLCIII